MRLGVDARLLTEQMTGIGRYTYEACRHLGRLNEQTYLYTPSPVPEAISSFLSPAIINSDCVYGRLRRMLWSQQTLPKRVAEDGIEVFWGATHRIPHRLDPSIARVVTIHDLVWKQAGATMRPFSRLMESVLMPRAIDSADLIMADSNNTAQELAAFYPGAADKVRVVHLGGSELPSPEPQEALVPLGIKKPYILFVGTLEPRKNLNRLLEAYSRLPLDLQSAYDLLIVGGKGWGNVDIDMLTKTFKIQNHVRALGYVSDETLATLYKHAIFLVMPSVYEGFGLPLVEAMRFGTPVLTSNTSSMPEVSGDAGFLVDPYSVESIQQGLQQMLCSSSLIERLSAAAPKVAARFNWQRTAHESMDVFKEALEIRRRKTK